MFGGHKILCVAAVVTNQVCIAVCAPIMCVVDTKHVCSAGGYQTCYRCGSEC